MSMIPYAARGGAMMVPMVVNHGPPPVLTPELIREAYRDTKWAARKIGKAYKRYRSGKNKSVGQSRRQITNPASRVGSNVGESNSKRVHTYSAGVLDIADNSLGQHDLALPQEGSTPAQRQRNLINLRGFKICMEFDFNSGSSAAAAEFYLNVAVVVDKKDTAKSSISGTRFFRDSNGTDRGIDFDAVPDALGKHCLPLNNDQLLVFMHKRMRIVTNPNQGSNCRLVNEYIPINRQIRFTETNAPDTRFHTVYWLSQAGTTGGTATVRATLQYRNITYFRETCTC